MTTLYGIKNCDTVKKAKTWLESHQVDFTFHDFRVDGLSEKAVKAWIQELGLEVLINKRSTTWKGLDEASKDGLNERTALELILAQPTLIKRPLLDTGSERLVGFKADTYSSLFSKD